MQNVSFQGSIPASEKRRNTTWSLVSIPALVATELALESMEPGVKQDTFMKTAKSCAKSFTKSRKEATAWLCKNVLRNENLANKVFAMANNNKKLFAACLAVEGLLSFVVSKLSMDAISKFKHRKDA